MSSEKKQRVERQTVCVTGATGFIASYCVQLLCERGFMVRGTLRSRGKAGALALLQQQYPDQIELFEADLLQEGSFDLAVKGCVGCLHLASPVFSPAPGTSVEEIQRRLVEPAVKGTLNVLRACTQAGPQFCRLVVTSSFATMFQPGLDPLDKVYNEDDWNNYSTVEMGGLHAYRVSKLKAEKALWEFMATDKPTWTACTINPCLVIGPLMQIAGELDLSSTYMREWINGKHQAVPVGSAGMVDARDVAIAHVQALTIPEASGRFLLCAGVLRWNEFGAFLRQAYPPALVPPDDGATVRMTLDTRRAQSVLGLKYRDVNDSLHAQLSSLIELGALPSPAVFSTEKFVQRELANVDGSHDYFHIDRVRKLALSLAKEEKVPRDRLEIVELAALLHDVKDWKYAGSDSAGPKAVRDFLLSIGYPADRVEDVVKIVENIGFKKELDGPPPLTSVEFGVVQDADRLDATGATGIARCFTFGGSRNRPIYDPRIPPVTLASAQQYQEQLPGQSPSVNHFYEKLLKLKDLMKTSAGRSRAEGRHAFMELFLEQFHKEVNGTA